MPDSDPTRRGWVAIQRNPRSGTGLAGEMLVDLVRGLRSHGFGVRLFKHRDRLAAWMDDQANRQRLVALVAAGGDGTVGDLINRYPGVPLAVLPMGTENLLARFLKIPPSGAAVARLIAAGEHRTLDLGHVGGRRFALMASAGFDAEVVRRLHAARTGPISHATYLQPIVDSLRNYQYPELRVWIDDQPEPQTATLVEIVNIPSYALGLPMASGAQGDDGRLDVRLFQQQSAFQMLWQLCNLAVGTHERLPEVAAFSARTVRIEADRPVPLQSDGDPAGFAPVEIGILPGAVTVFAPTGSLS